MSLLNNTSQQVAASESDAGMLHSGVFSTVDDAQPDNNIAVSSHHRSRKRVKQSKKNTFFGFSKKNIKNVKNVTVITCIEGLKFEA